MIHDEKGLVERAHLLFDVFLTALAFILAYYLKKYYIHESVRGLTIEPNYYLILLMTIIIWFVSFSLFLDYGSCHYMSFYKVAFKIVVLVTVNMVILIGVFYLLKSVESISRILFAAFYVINIFTLVATHRIIRYFIVRDYKNSYNLRNILIIGSRDRASDVIRSLTQAKLSGYNIIGCLEIGDKFVEKEVSHGVKTIGAMSDFFKVLQDKAIDEVIFAVPISLVNDFD